MKIIPLVTLILFTLGSACSFAENARVRTDQVGNVDKQGADEDKEMAMKYREYYASQGMAQAVQAGVAFRGAINANRATADGIAQARAGYMPAATQELDRDGNPGRCYKFSAGISIVVPCNADPVQQTGNQYVGTQYVNETKGQDSQTPGTSVGLVLQNRPSVRPKVP